LDLIVAFITGLTTGGLSCLAVQGGLLASSLAYQLEQDLQAQAGRAGFRPKIAQPIFLFLLAKVIAYTLLGLLLGALGSVLQLTPIMRAVLLIAIGIFMLGNGLRMLKVHPIFRYFVIEPPSALTRYIRRKSKNGASAVTPLFLGAMTILIPCGVTQAMMAVALGTGSALQGAALMLAFTLGTTPVFFSVAYAASRLGSTLEKYFTTIVAITVIILGLVSVDSGLTLAGSPVSFSRLISQPQANASDAYSADNQVSSSAAVTPTARQVSAGSLATPGATQAAQAPGDGYKIVVNNSGYSPKVLHLPAAKATSLKWVTMNTSSCSLAVVVPSLNYEKVLPRTGEVALSIPAQAKGTVIRYSCSMGMYTGQMVFDLD
jgi:uncharacterized protein